MTYLSIIIPVYNEELNLDNFFKLLDSQLEIIKKKNITYELIINDNCSNDDSWEKIRKASHKYNISAYRFARNYGFQASLMFGLRKAKGKLVIVLQSDLQDPPELIAKLVNKYEETNSQVILAIPTSRKDKFFIKKMRAIFYFLLKILSEYKVIKNTQDIYLLTRPVVDELIQSPLFNQFIRSRIIENYSNDLSSIQYEKGSRLKGKSSFNFPRLYSLAVDALLLQSSKLLRYITIFATIVFLFGILVIFVVSIGFLLGYKAPVSGYTSVLFLLILNLVTATLGFSLTLEYLKRQHKFNFHPDYVTIIEELHN